MLNAPVWYGCFAQLFNFYRLLSLHRKQSTTLFRPAVMKAPFVMSLSQVFLNLSGNLPNCLTYMLHGFLGSSYRGCTWWNDMNSDHTNKHASWLPSSIIFIAGQRTWLLTIVLGDLGRPHKPSQNKSVSESEKCLFIFIYKILQV